MPSSMKSKESRLNGPTEKKRVSLLVDGDDEEEEAPQQFVEETNPKNGDDNNNDFDNSKRRKKKKKKNGNSKSSSSKSSSGGSTDPAGYVSSHHSRDGVGRDDDILYYKNRRFSSLNSCKTSTTTSNNINGGINGDDDEDIDEEELFDDTFTFLMTARYPFEDCWKEGCGGRKNNDDDEFEDGEAREAMKKPTKSVKATWKSQKVFKATDPDRLCLPFWLGAFVIVSQLFIYTIVMGRLFQSRIPPNADPWLRMAQIFAVIVTLYTQSDFIDGIFLLTERWKAFAEISGPVKFNLHAICRIVAGNIGIASTFLLVMYSVEVVDLLLNFTAMEFVATLDDSAFELAAKGFLGGTLERKADVIRSFRYHPRNRRRRRRSRLCMFLFYFLIIFTAFFAIIILQGQRAVGIDNEVYIQFDDSRPLESLSGVSGVYKGCKSFRTLDTGDIGYIDVSRGCPNLPRKQTDKELPARSFVYCKKDLDGWVYLSEPTTKPCDKANYLLRSFLDEDPIPAHAFDILIHAKANWVMRKPDSVGGEAVLTNFVIGSVSSISSEFVFCGEGNGLKRTDKDEKRQRPFEPLPLDSLYYPIFDREDPEATEGEIYPAVFGQIYRPLFVRPVHEERSDGNKFQVILYDGLRWHKLYLNPLQFAHNITRYGECSNVDPACWQVFVKYFHSESSWRTNSTVAFFDKISDPVLILSPTDNGVPTDEDLVWYDARVDDNGMVRPDRIAIPEDLDIAKYGFECKIEVDLGCSNDETELRLDFGTDFFPSENSLYVFFGQGEADVAKLDTANRMFVQPGITDFSISENELVDFRFAESNNLHLFGSCVPAGTSCIQVVVADDFGDGVNGEYEFTYGSDEARGGNDGGFNCRLYHLGNGCTDKTQNTETGLIEKTECNLDSILENYPEIVVGEEIRVDPSANEFLGNTIAVTPLPTEFFGFDTSEPGFELICDENEIELHFDVANQWGEPEIGLFFGQSLDTGGGLETFETQNLMYPASRKGQFEMSSNAVTVLQFPWWETWYAFGTCIPADALCLQVVVTEEWNGIGLSQNLTITFGDDIILVGGDDDFSFWTCGRFQFGSGCENTLDTIPAECDPNWDINAPQDWTFIEF